MLYTVNNELEKLLEVDENVINTETGEVHDKQYLITLQEAFLSQTENFGLWLKNQNSFIDAIKAEEKALAERRKFLERRLERNENFCTQLLIDKFGGKFESAKVKLSLRKSESVEVDENKLDPRFIEECWTPKIKKAEIKNAIKAGEIVEGASLIEKQNLQIK